MIGGISNYGIYGSYSVNNSYFAGATGSSLDGDIQAKGTARSSPSECQTCRERKYQDGSNENVSFKAPTHISPNMAAGAVRAHESEHVANAYSKAAKDNGQVIRASVSIRTAVCPECGTTYVAGGTTSTMIRYQNEDNPYTVNRKSADAAVLVGQNLDVAV